MEIDRRPSWFETFHPVLYTAGLLGLDAYTWLLHAGRGTLVLIVGLVLQAPVLLYLVHLTRTPVNRRPRWDLARRYSWLTSSPARVSSDPADYMFAIGGVMFLLASWIASR